MQHHKERNFSFTNIFFIYLFYMSYFERNYLDKPLTIMIKVLDLELLYKNNIKSFAMVLQNLHFSSFLFLHQ